MGPWTVAAVEAVVAGLGIVPVAAAGCNNNLLSSQATAGFAELAVA